MGLLRSNIDNIIEEISSIQTGIMHIVLILGVTFLLLSVAGGAIYLHNRVNNSSNIVSISSNSANLISSSSVSPSSSPIQNSTNSLTDSPQPNPTSIASTDTCNSACQAAIDQKISSLKADLLKQLQSSSNTNNIQSNTNVTPPSVPKIYYQSMGISGSTQATTWTDMPGTTIIFDPANYPGAKAFFFDANLQSDAPDRTTYARIYDSTHSVGVIGSDMNYAGLAATAEESGPLTFLGGVMTLDVQVHSLIGNLATVQNPRIKIQY